MSSTHPLDGLIASLSAHAELPDRARDALRSLPFIVKQLSPGSELVHEGAPTPAVALIVSGFAIRYKATGEGERQILSLLITGDVLGFQTMPLGLADHSVQTLGPVEVAMVPRGAMGRLMDSDAAVLRAVLRSVLVDASIGREWLLNIGRRDARARLAHLLCEFASRMDRRGFGGDGYVLPMTQGQIADALGLTSVHVNRTIRSLKAEGLITRKGRLIHFPDITRLCEVGDFNALYLHLADRAD